MVIVITMDYWWIPLIFLTFSGTLNQLLSSPPHFIISIYNYPYPYPPVVHRPSINSCQTLIFYHLPQLHLFLILFISFFDFLVRVFSSHPNSLALWSPEKGPSIYTVNSFSKCVSYSLPASCPHLLIHWTLALPISPTLVIHLYNCISIL